MQWNAWWQWDPRQTSFLLVLLLVGAALALRAGLKDDEKRANASAGYAVMLALPAAFLIFVYPRLDSVQTFHPSMTSAGDRAELFSPMYSVGLLLMMIGLGLTCLALYRDRVKAEQLNFEWEAAHGDRWGEADRGGTAADRVVRPVAVSSKNVD
jgi:heme exporter protein C